MNSKSHYAIYCSIVLFLILSFVSINAKSQIITTIAGNTSASSLGDGGLAFFALLDGPVDLAMDGNGNLFVCDKNHFRIRKIDTAAVISTIGGNGTLGFSGDGGPATAASIHTSGITVDRHGNIYLGEYNGGRVRKITSAGNISTFAGTGVAGYTGDGGPASAAKISLPSYLAVDNSGNIYISCNNNCIRKVDTAGIISTFAGTGTLGFSGDGGPALAAQISIPSGLAFDRAGNLYFGDVQNQRIRKISTSGIISTIAGTGTFGYSGDGGPATAANLYYPGNIVLDSLGNIYVSFMLNNCIRKISATTGIISTIAGIGIRSYSGDGGLATRAGLDYPCGLAIDSTGNLYIGDYSNNRIRMISCIYVPNPGIITGIDSVCIGGNVNLTDTVSGGTWNSSNTAIATINASGVVTGVAPGLVTLRYVVSNSCGNDTAHFRLRVKRPEDCLSGIGSLQLIANGIHFYPNPNQGTFIAYLNSLSNDDALLTISDLLGQKVYQSTLAANKETDIKLDVPSGIYLVVATLNGERFTSHLVVQ
jgi:sugar lactone lactonase YvrE